MSHSRHRPPRRSRFGIPPTTSWITLPRRPVAWADRPSTTTCPTGPSRDDWPERIPVTDAEVDVFEAWFGDLFDELFGPCR